MVNILKAFFVSEAMQSQSIGKILLNYVKNTRSKLILNVYQKTHQQYLFIKEKDLKFSTAAWMKLPEKKITEWRGSRSKNTVFQTVIETHPRQRRGAACRKKVRFLFCASCDSTHKINLRSKFIKTGGVVRPPSLLPLCGNSPVYLGFYTREEKLCPEDAVFLQHSIESVVSIERLLEKR